MKKHVSRAAVPLRNTRSDKNGARPMKKKYDFKNAERGRFAKTAPTLEGRGVQRMHPRVINVSFDVTQEVAAALRALRDTGLFGSGVDCASIAEELLRRALFQPGVIEYWRKL